MVSVETEVEYDSPSNGRNPVGEDITTTVTYVRDLEDIPSVFFGSEAVAIAPWLPIYLEILHSLHTIHEDRDPHNTTVLQCPRIASEVIEGHWQNLAEFSLCHDVS